MDASWWKSHFSVETLSGYGLEDKAEREAAGAARLLRLNRGDLVLDLCCGAGRHSIPLAERGLRVTGFDLMPELLAAARKEAESRGVALELCRGDMRRLRFDRRFDAVLNLFTSFGYFATDEEHLSALEGARRALKPGGSLLMDLLNKEWLMRHFTPRFRRKSGKGPVASTLNLLSFNLASGRLDTRRTLFLRDGRRRSTRLSIRIYTLTEIRRLMEQAGLEFERAYGDLQGRPYGMDSFRMAVVARRPEAGSLLIVGIIRP